MLPRVTLSKGLVVKKLSAGALITLALALSAAPASANHSWNGYHWAQASTASGSRVHLDVGTNLTNTGVTNWPAIFNGTVSGIAHNVLYSWDRLDDRSLIAPSRQFPNATNNVDTLDLTAVPGANLTSQKRCKAVSGRVEVCNARYGRNGWLGLAQIWLSGGHIVKGTTKVNDSYLDSSSYTNIGRQSVLCQEIGHDWGLDHQDESGADFDTCMDYSDAFDNPFPNGHDSWQLDQIYHSHDDASSGAAATATNGRSGTTRRVGRDEYVTDLGNGARLVTHVTWVDDDAAAAAPNDHVPE